MAEIYNRDGSVNIRKVARKMEKSSSFNLLLRNWKQFGRNLEVSEMEIQDLDRRLKLESPQLNDVPLELLQVWKANRGKGASIDMICKALADTGMPDVANSLELAILSYHTSKSRSRLLKLDDKVRTGPMIEDDRAVSSTQQGAEWDMFLDGVENSKAIPKGQSDPLQPDRVKSVLSEFRHEENLLSRKDEDVLSSTEERNKETKIVRQLKFLKLELLNDELKKTKQNIKTQLTQLINDNAVPPQVPKYYVPRTLLYYASFALDENIFTSDYARTHVFIFKGSQRRDIARLSGWQAVESSGSQLDIVTAQFILLECDEDFDVISNNFKHPVHLIQYENGEYFWIKSNSNLELIRRFLKYERISFSEKELVSKIESATPPCAFCISDTPGAGKTLLLAGLAAEIQQKESIVLFLTLHEFINIEEFDNFVASSLSALEAIASYSATNEAAKLILLEMLNNDSYQLYLFLDGYDEVDRDKLDLVDTLLKQVKDLKNVKIVLTTRPSYQSRVETIFDQFSYEIQPLTESNQIDVLTKYWIVEHRAENNQSVKDFAKICSAAMTTALQKEEVNIVGIPLLCMILAEVYAYEAIKSSNDFHPHSDSVSVSLFQLFKSYLNLKLGRHDRKTSWVKCLNAHVYASVELLLPKWAPTLKPLFVGLDQVDEETLYSMGLLHKTSHANIRRFVHRTFAEFLLAEYVATNLDKNFRVIALLFGKIIGQNGTVKNESENSYGTVYELKHPVIVHFIELHLKQSIEGPPMIHWISFRGITNVDICVTINASCGFGYECIVDYSIKILLQIRINKNICKEYFRTLPHLIVERFKETTILKKVFDFEKQILDVDLNYHVLKQWRLKSFLIPNFTPLHTAVHIGRYNFAMFLINEYRGQVHQVEYLLHACVFDSTLDEMSVIEEKLLIIDMLVSTNPGWLEEKYEGKPPLLQFNVHFKLLESLVKHGADINACSPEQGTVLHWIGDKSNYTSVVILAFSKGFTAINFKDSKGRTALMNAIEKFGNLGDRVLKLLHDRGADFNARDNDEDSVLFYALRWSDKIDFINKLLEYGANVHHRNKKNQSALHIVMEVFHDSEYAIELLKMLEGEGVNQYIQNDVNGLTPVDLAKRLGTIMNAKLLTYLREKTFVSHTLSDELKIPSLNQMRQLYFEVPEVEELKKFRHLGESVLRSAESTECKTDSFNQQLEPLPPDMSNYHPDLIDCQEETSKISIGAQDSKYTLPQAMSFSPEESPQETSDSMYRKIENELKKVSSERTQILKKQSIPPELPKYYIPRILSYVSESPELDVRVFSSESTRDHIFVFKDIDKHELARILETSGSQSDLEMDRFVKLERDNDFEMISKKTTNPVHLIQHEKGRFFWVKSSQNEDLIREYLKGELNTVNEDEMILKIQSLLPPCMISITAETPGMGSTLLLSSIASKIEDAIMIFVDLQNFVRQLDFTKTSLSAIEAIAWYATCNDASQKVLLRLLRNHNPIYYFLDGYDHILPGKLDSFLKQLRELDNAKIIITRLSHPNNCQNIVLDKFSCKIQPFNQVNQIDVLTSYWEVEVGVKGSEQLKIFAMQCLKALEPEEISGVPLHCTTLAEVFADDAKIVSKLESMSYEEVRPIAFFQLYERLIDLKFRKIPTQISRQYYLKLHVDEAIKSLFPAWTEEMKPIVVEYGKFDEEIMFSIGLLEKNLTSRRFIHKIFAEYLLASFIAENLEKHIVFTDLLLREILGLKGTMKVKDRDSEHFYCQLKYPDMAYFLEKHLQQVPGQMSHALLSPASTYPEHPTFRVEDLCVGVSACCSNDLEFIFDHLTTILQCYNISAKEVFMLYDVIDLLHVLVETSNNVKLLEKVLKFIYNEFFEDERKSFAIGKETFISSNDEKYALITHLVQLYSKIIKLNFQTIPVPVLRLQAKHAMATFFPHWIEILELNDEIEVDEHLKVKLPTYIHSTIAEYLLAEFVVQNLGEDWQILDLLFGEILGRMGTIQKKGNDEILYDFKYPGIVFFIKKQLKMYLTQHSMEELFLGKGRNFYRPAFNSDDVCVSIVACSCSGYDIISDYATKLLSRCKFKDEIRLGRTPLMNTIRIYGSLDNKVLKMFQEAGSDFNAKDCNGDSVLFYALQHFKSVSLIKKLLSYDVDVKHTNKRRENALHKVIEGNGSIENKLLVINMLLDINSGLLEEKDDADFTPLLKCGHNTNLLDRLVQQGADINAYSSLHGTIIHSTCDKNDFIPLARCAISNEFKLINHTDKLGRTPIMYAIQRFGTIEEELLSIFHENGVDLNAQDLYGDSELFYAIKYSGNASFIRKLLNYGANVNHKNKKQQNVLHKLVEANEALDDRLELLDVFVKVNKDLLKENDSDYCPPLIQRNVQFCLLRHLVELGADINAYDSQRGTVLHCSNKVDTFQQLVYWALSNGFQLINHTNGDKITPLMHAIKEIKEIDDGMLELFRKSGADFNSQDSNGDSLLFYAVKYLENVNLISRMIEYGADVNHRNLRKQTAMHIVVVGEGSIENKWLVFKMLAQISPALLNETDENDCTPLLQDKVDLTILGPDHKVTPWGSLIPYTRPTPQLHPKFTQIVN